MSMNLKVTIAARRVALTSTVFPYKPKTDDPPQTVGDLSVNTSTLKLSDTTRRAYSLFREHGVEVRK